MGMLSCPSGPLEHSRSALLGAAGDQEDVRPLFSSNGKPSHGLRLRGSRKLALWNGLFKKREPLGRRSSNRSR